MSRHGWSDAQMVFVIVNIKYESWKSLKSHVLVDFVAEMTPPASSTHGTRRWTTFIDGALSSTGSGADIIIENGEGILVKVSLELTFPTSSNQEEYEAFLVGLRLVEVLGSEETKICTNSQLVA